MSSAQETVLVLDDEASVRDSLSRLLLAHGFQVRCFSKPAELFSAGQPDGPACLLLDQNLGHDRGVKVHEQMQALGWCIPTVFLTADWDIHTVVDAMRGGAVNYLTKPFDPEEMLQVVRKALKRSAEQAAEDSHLAMLRHSFARLTPRERMIVSMVAKGMLNKQIADQLGVALVTVKLHRGRAMKKLGAINTADLARISVLIGI